VKPLDTQRVLIIGAGGWGTALAILLANKGYDVWLWGRNEGRMAQMEQTRENSLYLPGIPLPEGVRPISGPVASCPSVGAVLLTVPSQGLRGILREFKDYLSQRDLIINGAKGLERGSLLRLSQVIEEELPGSRRRLAVLSGPNHAEEIGQGLPAAGVVAGYQRETTIRARQLLMSPTYRVYSNDDVAGVELAGALKNVIALGAGMCQGLGLGDNAQGALITRGITEIARLGVRLGARPLTFLGLAGIGDLIVTCTSQYSRNAWAGRQLGQGKKLADFLASTQKVVEGIPTVQAAVELARLHQVEMPITTTLYEIIYHDRSPLESVKALMERGAKGELEDVLDL
jgi:glycerol-3-phosphate dehydrogenase (NAD(P)+)